MPKVLIVGERDLAPELGGTLLFGPGIERLVASTPSAALEIAPTFVPSLVVLEGADHSATRVLIQQLRESAGTRRSSIAVIALSPTVTQDEMQQAGANLVLNLPADTPVWDEALNRLLAIPRRVRTQFSVRFRSLSAQNRGGPVDGVALDLSQGGMLLETGSEAQPGEVLDLTLALPGQPKEVSAIGRVVRRYGASLPFRLGVRFLDPSPDVLMAIEGMLSSSPPELSFGRYEVQGLLGEGSMGRVYRGFDPLARRAVAIKTLKQHLLDSAASEDYLGRFRREAQAAARLVHPNIVTIFDVAHDFFVMELLDGTTLQVIFRDHHQLTPAEVQRLLAPVAEALDYAHARGTVHRDIKPANIMVLLDGKPKVTDFGIAHLISPTITPAGHSFGSPGYMAPEQITQSQVGPASDLFALAVVAYEALTGHRPFEGDGVIPILYNVVNVDPPPPTQWNPTLPPVYDEIFRRALAKNPAQRFPTGSAFLAALDPQPGASVASTPVATPVLPDAPSLPALVDTVDLKPPKRPVSRRTRWGVAAALLLGVAAAGATRLPAWRAPAPSSGLEISTVPAGATVLLDGTAMGRSPLLLTRLPRGAHAIKVVHEDYAPAELNVEATGEGPPVPLHFTLWPLTAVLQIESDPPGATVEVDGQRSGMTPAVDLQLSPGTHNVVLTRAGFRSWAQTVETSPGETLRLAARLQPSDKPASMDALRAKGWVRAGDLMETGSGVTPPRRIAGEPAAYPPAARRMRLQGSVTAELIVTETGEVVDPRIVESAGEVLDEAFLKALRGWRYEPAEMNGVKVRVRHSEHQIFGSIPRY